MLGAIIGDIVGSRHEGRATKTVSFPLLPADCVFTDDTVCTVAIADALLRNSAPTASDFASSLRRWCRRYPDAGYGSGFKAWMLSDAAPAPNSYGNGGAMRAAPIAWAAPDRSTAIAWARAATIASHRHEQAVAGACAVVDAIWLARSSQDKAETIALIQKTYGYAIDQSIADMRPGFGMDLSTVGTVPPALRCVLEADDYETAIRLAVSLGGDADTLACIAGGVMEAFAPPAQPLRARCLERLDEPLLKVAMRFERRFMARGGLFSRLLSAARW